MKIRPLGDRVLVEPVEEEQKVGDEVLLPKYGGTEVKLGDKKLQLVREDDLLGVLEK